DRHRSKK
ncbi:hypothetical protein BN1708_019025, partial [Verticillium longisporum]